MQNGTEITLREHKLLVLPQSIGYLSHKLGPRLKEILETDLDGLDGVDVLTAKTYETLAVFIPSLPDTIPLYEFLGYASTEAMEAKRFDEEADRSPTAPQVKAAFDAAFKVNGGEVLASLKALLGPAITEKVMALVTASVAEKFPSKIRESSQISPSTSGESASMSSSPMPQTSVPSPA
jgi:hypothetical protein